MAIRYLNAAMIEALALPTEAVMNATRDGLLMHARGEAMAEPTVSFHPLGECASGIFTIRGSLTKRKIAAVKSVGSFPINRAKGLRPDMGLMTLFDAETGQPLALLDASPITTLRTAAVSAVGAIALAKPDSKILGCLGSRGIVAETIRMIQPHFRFREIRVYSPNDESRRKSAENLSRNLNANVVPVASADEAMADADIMIDGASHSAHNTIFPIDEIQSGATIICYAAYSSFPEDIPDRVDSVIVDRWVNGDTGATGALGPAIASGKVTKGQITHYLGDIIDGITKGRNSPVEKILFSHRGIAACDITLALSYLDRSVELGAGETLDY